MPNPNPPLQLSYWFAVYSISSRKRCSEKKCNQYHVCFADQKNISDSMTWKILMQPIIFCGVANLVEETEMIFFLGKQSNTCYVQELNILWSFMLSYSNPSHKIWFFCRKLYYYNSKRIVMPCYNCKRIDRGLIIPTCVSKVSNFPLLVAGILGNGGGPRYLQK